MMVDLGNPLYFCEWLKRYLDEGGGDLSMIGKMVEIPIKCKRGMVMTKKQEDDAYGQWLDSDPY